MNERNFNDFGIVDSKGDFFEFRLSEDPNGKCHLEGVIQTERGPRRTALAVISAHIWKLVSERTIRELAAGMGETERTKNAPTLKVGINQLSPLIGRELAVLLWALMEVAIDGNIEAILHGWRELAREERWWLYAKCAAPGQRTGVGWRLALFHALSETTDSRSVKAEIHEKKKPGSGSRSSKSAFSKNQPESKKNSNRKNPKQKMPNTRSLPKPISTTITRSKKQPLSHPAADLTKRRKRRLQEKKAKKTTRKATTTS